MEAEVQGLVPEFEEREAAVFVHIAWEEWQVISGLERAKAVAHYRMHSMIEAHVNDAVSKKV